MAGFDPRDLPDFPQLAEQIDIVRERIRRIEARAIQQLCSPERARQLRALLAASSVRRPEG